MVQLHYRELGNLPQPGIALKQTFQHRGTAIMLLYDETLVYILFAMCRLEQHLPVKPKPGRISGSRDMISLHTRCL